jgi:hypothetical protein
MDKSIIYTSLVTLASTAAFVYIGKKHEENQKKKKIVEELIESMKDANAINSVSFS